VLVNLVPNRTNFPANAGNGGFGNVHYFQLVEEVDIGEPEIRAICL
jgi:hypothetical protein